MAALSTAQLPATSTAQLPLIDISPLLVQDASEEELSKTVELIDRACRDYGFFLIKGHGVDPSLQQRMHELSMEFFTLPEEEKALIKMSVGGSAWRGWFPVGGELTSGLPDQKEGLYFGEELPQSDPRVVAALPLHGPNLFPERPSSLSLVVNSWFNSMRSLGLALLRGVALGLKMPPDWFSRHVAADPTCLFRIFHYPPSKSAAEWGVGEHTDYGLITLLAQDACGGLQVKLPHDGGWLEVPALENVFVVNLGDMLDRLTEGRYRSTPHRVKNASGRDRLSFPFFMDPSWGAVVKPLPLEGAPPSDDKDRRWDGSSVHAWEGTYGTYLTAKVSRCFPELFTEQIIASEGGAPKQSKESMY